mmetsp:Transcript_33836/g.55873  ORF Transcript_33836/g.55873 Transcript_33836/m.55873 type:complete len:310 (+) Transcript_33836:2-931(+)
MHRRSFSHLFLVCASHTWGRAQSASSADNEAVCEGHGYSRAQCSRLGCCAYEDGECWAIDGVCRGTPYDTRETPQTPTSKAKSSIPDFMKPKSEPDHLQAAATIIEKFDENKDNLMSARELRKSGMIKGLGIEEASGKPVEPIVALRMLDTDKSGMINSTELANFIERLHSQKDTGQELMEHQAPVVAPDEDDDSAEEDVLWRAKIPRKRKPGEAQPPRNKKPVEKKDDLPPEVRRILGGRSRDDLVSLLPDTEQTEIHKRRMARGERIPEKEPEYPEDDPEDVLTWEKKSAKKRRGKDTKTQKLPDEL